MRESRLPPYVPYRKEGEDLVEMDGIGTVYVLPVSRSNEGGEMREGIQIGGEDGGKKRVE
eukprot:767743-Hanusia_phi.AAC.1